MDGCMRAGPTLPVCRLRTTPPLRSTYIPASPLTVPDARRSPAASRQRGSGGGPSSGRMPATPTGQRRCSTPRPGSGGRRRSCWRSAPAPVPRRWRWRRPSRTSMSSPSRCTGGAWHSSLAGSTAKASPTSGWSAVTVSTCSSTCSAPGSLTGVRVFFPDPWPKARHHKRRLIQPAVVALIADRLCDGGVLHAATDHAGYAEQIAEVGDAEPRLQPGHRNRHAAHLGAPTRHEVRDQGPSRGQRRRRTALGETTMSLTEDIRQV